MVRKRKKQTVLPVVLDPVLKDRAKAAAEWEARRLQCPIGVSTLLRQGLEARVTEIERQQRDQAAA